MVSEGGAGGEEDINRAAGRLWHFAKADAVAAEQRTEEPDVVDDGICDRPTSVISRRRVRRAALSIIITQRTISTRQHPVEDETDPEVTFKTTNSVAKP